MISALLVGMIVVATLTGFDVVGRASADQRQHNEAIGLAAQSQEQLRSDPADTLTTLQLSPHSFTQTIGGTTYTIVQKAELQGSGGGSVSCNVTESERQGGNAYRITSTVTWNQQEKAKRAAVVASSLVTPPVGSGLEVDADNAPTPTAGVSGITAVVKFTPLGSGSQVAIEQTTESQGCVVFGGIPATSALVEIKKLAGFVTRWGANEFPTKEVTIAPNYTTHYPVVYNLAGTMKALFTYNGEPEYKHPSNSGSEEVAEAVKGDTFVVFNSEMSVKPDYEVGSTRYNAPTTVYNPIPATSSAVFEASALSPGNLFPFTSAEPSWNVYAGDCVENEPKTVTSGEVKPPEKIYVTPGGTTEAKVPTSYVTLNLYKGSEQEVSKLANKWENLETTTSRPVTVTNLKCAGTTPNNESAVSVKHLQATTTGATNGGHLERPFQPFAAEMEMCVAAGGKTYTRKYEDKKLKLEPIPIYMGQKSTQEKTKLHTEEVTAETKANEKRESEENAITTKRTTQETNRIKREATEATERSNWKKEKEKGKITQAKYEEELAKQTTKREALVKTEEKEREKWTEEETTLHNTKKTEEAKKKAREERETAEANEEKADKVTVETAASCP